VIAAAQELFEARHYPGVVALVNDALDAHTDQIPLLLLRARAHIALRRDLDAQADLRDIIRLDPQCALAFRLLGELAARRDENESAAIFFREALRLDPDDREASEWLAIVEISARPAAAANKLPAPVAAAGRFPPARGPVGRAQTATGVGVRTLSSPARTDTRPGSQPRFAKGTSPPIDTEERPTDRKPMLHLGGPPARGSEPNVTPTTGTSAIEPIRTLPGHPTLRAATQNQRGSTPELPGFGEYLVSTGILTRERLRAAQAYQRSMKVQLSTAIVTLGLATPQRIEWAAVAHQSQLARERTG
jgi:tetratricopeptide (TPR) repeat protein